MGRIKGKIVDASTGESIPGVNIYAINEAEQSLGFGTGTDADGVFDWEHPLLDKGDQKVKFSHIGMQPIVKRRGDIQGQTIYLQPSINTLGEVVVHADPKPEPAAPTPSRKPNVLLLAAVGLGSLVLFITLLNTK